MQSAEIELRNNREGLEKSAGGGKEGGQNLTKTVLRIAEQNRPYKICNSIFEVISIFKFVSQWFELFKHRFVYHSFDFRHYSPILDALVRF